MASAALTVGIPAYQRVEPLLVTLSRILACSPPPDEIIVHIDGAVEATRHAIAEHFPSVKIISSVVNLGPGGARNRLIREASHEWIATFDDDSYPEDSDYFGRVLEDIANNANTAVFTSDSTDPAKRDYPLQKVAVFSGCGCIYNREWYLKTKGYVPRVVAYGFEEVDLSLQLHAKGGQILLDPRLNVIHDHPITGAFPEKIIRESILNAFLFPWVRYPLLLLPLGLIQALRYTWKAACSGDLPIVVRALQHLPTTLIEYQHYRFPVSAGAVLSWLRLRRSEVSLRSASPS
jgi:GT2 family glycosyltransferase